MWFDTCHEKIDLFGVQNIVIHCYSEPDLLLEPILHKFEDPKNVNFLNPEEVYFLVTRVICRTEVQRIGPATIWSLLFFISVGHYDEPASVVAGQNILLFNLATDPNEEQEVSVDHEDVVMELLHRLSEYNKTAVPPQTYERDYVGANPALHDGAWMPWTDDEVDTHKDTSKANIHHCDCILVTAIMTIYVSISVIKNICHNWMCNQWTGNFIAFYSKKN